MIIDKKLLEKQIKTLAKQLNKKTTKVERDDIEGLLNLLSDLSDQLPLHPISYKVNIVATEKSKEELYKVRLLDGHIAQKEQYLKEGDNIYLGFNTKIYKEIIKYSKKEAQKKAVIFGGKIEKA